MSPSIAVAPGPCTGCPICGVETSRSVAARVTPFVRARAQIPQRVDARSFLCASCQHVFLTPFLTSDQLQRLFHDYRGDGYNTQRREIEADYVSRLCMLRDRNSDYHAERRAFYDTFHGDRFETRGLVVDIGDGDGYFARYAYPHADVVTFPRIGVPTGVRTDELLAAADVLMMAYNLQGEPFPRQRLCTLTRLLAPGAQVWIETSIQFQGTIDSSFAVLEARERCGMRELGPLQTLDETLSHFSVTSVKRLLKAAGLRPIELARSSNGILGVLAVHDAALSPNSPFPDREAAVQG